jgi:ribosomal protein S18 acetylase RimI-like enzyme
MRETDPDAGGDNDLHSATPVTGIVFRRLRAPTERKAAKRLLADGGALATTVDRNNGIVLFGLWDLAAPDPEALVAAAATRPADAGAVELCAIVVRAGLRHQGLGRRLVAEVADALRAKGAARLVTRLEGDHGPVAALLRRAGFVAAITDADGQSAGMEAARLYLEL